MTESKPAIRRMMLHKREALRPEVLAQAGLDAANALRSLSLYQDAAHLGITMAHRGEVDPMACVHDAWAMGKRCYLPVVTEAGGMRWRAYGEDTVLTKNRYGIFEPADGAWISAQDLDMVLLPMVAFNAQRQRLGYGGGYFDRCFAACPRPCLIGLAYTWQRNDDWVAELTDLACDQILTV